MRSRVPESVLGHAVPPRFRSRRMHFVDAASALRDFIGWLDETQERAGAERPDGGSAPVDGERDADRARLVELCADLHDRITSEGLRDKLRHGLRRVGVELLVADGDRFDPERHEALGELATADPDLDGLVAATQRIGWSDRGRLAREPQVLVYRLFEADGPTPD